MAGKATNESKEGQVDALVGKIRKGDKMSEIKDEIILGGLKENNINDHLLKQVVI